MRKLLNGSILVNTIIIYALAFTLTFLAFNKFYKNSLQNLSYKENANMYYAAKDSVMLFNNMLNDHFNNINKQEYISLLHSINPYKNEEDITSKFNNFIMKDRVNKFTPQNKFEYILNVNDDILNVCVEYKYDLNSYLDKNASKKIRFVSTVTNLKNDVCFEVFGCINFNLKNIKFELDSNKKISRFDFISDEYFLIEYIVQLEINKPNIW